VNRVQVVVGFIAHQPFRGGHLQASPLGRLVPVAEALKAPLGLAISNELAHQLKRDLPNTFDELKRGLVERKVWPLYTLAHETPAALLEPAELFDELRLNCECLEAFLGAPRPELRGVVPAIAAKSLAGSAPLAVGYTIAPRAGAACPFRLGDRLLALPEQQLELDADEDVAIARVAQLIDETPPGGVLAFLHDLSQLERVRRLWGALSVNRRIVFVSAEEALKASLVDSATTELELAAEPAPLAEGVTGALEWLVEAFGFSRTPPLAAQVLFDEDYRLERLPPRAQVPMLLRMVKAGCGLRLDADEARAKRPFLDGFRLCDALAAECHLADTRPAPERGLSPEVLHGLERGPELVVDPRLIYWQIELERLQARGHDGASARSALDEARLARQRAGLELDGLRSAYGELIRHAYRGRARWQKLVVHLRDHLGSVCVALDRLEQAASVRSMLHPAARTG